MSTDLSVFNVPRCLISCDTSGTLQVQNDVLSQVQTLGPGLEVVAITGLYRTGKSFLMNRLYGQNSGFPLGPTVEAETKGIWIWGKPHPTRPGKHLLLLDTEGLGDVKGDATHDVKIFTLAMLLSSVLVYNIISAINSDALNLLSFVTEMSKHVQVATAGDTPEQYQKHLPDFIFAVRDFTLDLEIDGKAMTSQEYMEHCLTGSNNKNEGVNSIKQNIKRLFPKRKCFTFVWPAESKQLKDLEKLTEGDLDDDFVKEAKMFSDYILQEGSDKTLDGRLLDGKMWAGLVQQYVQTIAKGRIPNIQTAVELLAGVENPKAIAKALRSYNAAMKTLRLPTKNAQVMEIEHLKAETASIAEFQKNCVFDSDGEFLDQLKQKISEEREAMISRNEQASDAKCREKLGSLEPNLQAKLASGAFARPGGYRAFLSEYNAIMNNFQAEDNLGVKAEDILKEFKKRMEETGKMVDATETKIREKHEERNREEQRRQQAEEAAREAENRRQQAEQRARDAMGGCPRPRMRPPGCRGGHHGPHHHRGPHHGPGHDHRPRHPHPHGPRHPHPHGPGHHHLHRPGHPHPHGPGHHHLHRPPHPHGARHPHWP